MSELSSNRRQLAFSNWDEVESDLRALQQGYKQNGAWDLSQNAKHLNDWLGFPMDGFPKAPIFLRALFAVIRGTVGKRMLATILAEQKMKDGLPTAPETVHLEDAEVDSVINKLIETIHRFRDYEGEVHPSPLYGAMDKSTAEKLQFVHFAHHLSWLSPKNS